QSTVGGSFSGPRRSISAIISASVGYLRDPIGRSRSESSSTTMSNACPSSRRRSEVTAFGRRTARLLPHLETRTCVDIDHILSWIYLVYPRLELQARRKPHHGIPPA